MSILSNIRERLSGLVSKKPTKNSVCDMDTTKDSSTQSVETTWKNMCISPSGAWFDPPTSEPVEEHTTQHPLPPIPTITADTIQASWNAANAGPVFMVVEKPPHFYPHKDELHLKLEQCLDLGIITSCIHKSSGRAYLLDIELPGTNDRPKDLEKIKLFIRVMEKQYKLVIVQQNAINKLTAPGSFYRTIFEYKEETY